MFISVIIPAYNEESQIKASIEDVARHLPPASSCELIFVDDGSADGTAALVKECAKNAELYRGDLRHFKVRLLSFSRNFGKETAVRAGIREAAGDCAIIMDCDLQHPPRYIPRMVELWREGNDVVEGIRNRSSKEGLLYKIAAATFYSSFSLLAGLNFRNVSDFQLIDRKVIDVINLLDEKESFYRGLSRFAGFKRSNFYFDVDERKNGSSNWTKIGLAKMAVNSMLSFSARPLWIMFAVAALCFLSTIFYALLAAFRALIDIPLPNFNIYDFFLLFSATGGFFTVALCGLYISRINEEVKRRPLYVLKERWPENGAEPKDARERIARDEAGESDETDEPTK